MGDRPAGGRLGIEGGEGGGEIKERIDTHHTCKCINHTGSHWKLKPSKVGGVRGQQGSPQLWGLQYLFISVLIPSSVQNVRAAFFPKNYLLLACFNTA